MTNRAETATGDWNMGAHGTMLGPNEFLYTGNLKDWNRVPKMPRIKAPARPSSKR